MGNTVEVIGGTHSKERISLIFWDYWLFASLMVMEIALF